MYAVEFETEIENGIIQIPETYHELQGRRHVKLVIIYEKSVKNDNALEESEIKAFSNHSADLIDEWKDESEDAVWQ